MIRPGLYVAQEVEYGGFNENGTDRFSVLVPQLVELSVKY